MNTIRKWIRDWCRFCKRDDINTLYTSADEAEQEANRYLAQAQQMRDEARRLDTQYQIEEGRWGP